MKRPHKVSIRLSDEELEFLESFDSKGKTDVLRRALFVYIRRIREIRLYKEY